ncbi:MAG: PrsW family intramembrane metalloprotease [Anaerolineae bacterium]
MPQTLTPGVVLASLIAVIAPTLVYVLIIWHIDRYEKEPLHLLATAFVWGAVPAVVASMVLELLFDIPLATLAGGLREMVSVSLVAPPVEEAFKGLALLGVFLLARHHLDGVLDGVVYGSLIGLGFAMTENLFYFFGAWGEGGLPHWSTVVLLRAVVFGWNHALFTAMTGIGFGLARYSRSRGKAALYILGGLLTACLLHVLHNTLVGNSELCAISLLTNWGGMIALIVVVLLAWRRERGIIRTHLAEEVRGGLLSAPHYAALTSPTRRLVTALHLGTHPSRAQARTWRQLNTSATRLAFLRHQQAATGGDPATGARIAALRGDIARLEHALLPVETLCQACGQALSGPAARFCPSCGAQRGPTVRDGR